jgi:shikimate kinase
MGEAQALDAIKSQLNGRSIVMVGLMGCGKSAVGRRLASRLRLPFVDADEEIEKAAGKSIEDIFEDHGEAYFREGERKVLARLLRAKAQVLATGGGAFMNAETRAAIAQAGITVWLKADLPLLVRRVAKRNNRPLLKNGDPEAVMQRLMDERYPIYAEADVTVQSRDVPHEVIVNEILERLSDALEVGAPQGDAR